ncbi:MAG: hypothetical protein VKP62_08790 [Candidatus Sericytochromatia bacterium]|nr:hypothetical protein [Candidatus Sericytochromatia bacterium]
MEEPEAWQFARAFFTAWGGTWHDTQPGVAEVDLVGALQEAFAVPRLTLLARPNADVAGELVAPGSRLFHLVSSFLGARGRAAVCELVPGDFPEPILEIRAQDTEFLGQLAAPQHFGLYDFKFSFLSDEIQEQLHTVILDGEGQLVAADACPDLFEAAWRDILPQAGQAPGRYLTEAAELARAAAERLAIPLADAAAARLAVVSERLQRYFVELASEVPVRPRRGQSIESALEDTTRHQQDLLAELARRRQEEARRHQLRVQIRPLGYALVQVPGRRYSWRAQQGLQQVGVTIWQNLVTGEVRWPTCARCAQPTGRLSLCREGHLACDACAARCEDCHQWGCRAELRLCESCGAAACASCLVKLACGHWACGHHAQSCLCCGQSICPLCAKPCPLCPSDQAWLLLDHACPRHGRRPGLPP